ncbi:hypothetical protein J5N97_029025 [Dioscorea zingiberensis]|uniref:Uncharacterized protein n=1 Tax=Dioscorea zingiberensis TaxID=325984 RepID=A0A9D5H5G0_9LILI|nr:hypothetical protein J5N97_029025 [Dioscorea zingiberensis]
MYYATSALLRFPAQKKPLKPSSNPFDETLIWRLKALLPIPASSPAATIPLSWISLVADLLVLTLAYASAIISDPAISDSDALSDYLDASVALLDDCNAISAEIDRVARSRLYLRLALHHLSASPPNLPRAKELIAKWERSPGGGALKASVHLGEAPRGKVSVVRRAIYAVEAVSSLVAGSVAAVLGGGETKDLDRIHVSNDSYPWAPAFNKVLAAVSERAKAGPVDEVAAVEAAVRRLTAVIDGKEEGMEERLPGMVEETEKTMEAMLGAMDRLAEAISGVFRAAYKTRKAALQSFRISFHQCN